jgi:hypothetical protein
MVMVAADGAAMEAVVDLMASVLAIMAAALTVTTDLEVASAAVENSGTVDGTVKGLKLSTITDEPEIVIWCEGKKHNSYLFTA